MTVLEAMNLLGLPQRPVDRAAIKLAIARALEQTPRQHELLEEAQRCLNSDLEARESAESRQTRIERHSTREILLFDENRDAVMFGDEAPELPVAFRAPPMDDAHWMGDDSVIFEGESAMTSELPAMMSELPSAVAPEASSAAASETADSATAEILDSVSAQIEAAALPQAETVSGEWQLMLESLEAEGLIKPEEGFSDALSAQMLTLSDTHPEHLVDNALLFQTESHEAAPHEAAPHESVTHESVTLESVTLESVTLEAAPYEPITEPNHPTLEPRALELPLHGAALLETPLFSTPLFATPMLGDAQPSHYASALETPLFAPLPLDPAEHLKAVTFDDSLLISHGAPVTTDADTKPHWVAPLQAAPLQAAPLQAAPLKTLETLPSRKAPVATQLSLTAAPVQPSESPKKQVTGRAGLTNDLEVMRADRRSDAQPSAAKPSAAKPSEAKRSAAKSVVPRTYRDVREPITQVRRRRQPVAVWLLSLAALLGSAVFIAPNLAAQLRDSLLPRAAALTKPSAGAVVAKPPVRIVKPAAIRPVSAAPGSSKTVKPATAQPLQPIKPSGNPPTGRQPTVSPTPRAVVAVNPSAAVVTPASRATVVTAAPVRAAPRVSASPRVSAGPRVSPTPSSAASLPPVTRPEGFASSGVGKPASKPRVSTKPTAAPVKPVVKPGPSPAPAPVASIEYQDKPAAAQELPGGLSRQEFGRQFLNRKQFEVWQAQQQELRFGSFAQIPLETQVLEAEAFRAAVLIPAVRPTRPERP